MYKFKNSLIAAVVLWVLVAAASVYPESNGAPKISTPVGDVAFELIGQVRNPSPTTFPASTA